MGMRPCSDSFRGTAIIVVVAVVSYLQNGSEQPVLSSFKDKRRKTNHDEGGRGLWNW